MECPRCGYQQDDANVECAACGVILAKARPFGVGASPTPGADDDHTNTTRIETRESWGTIVWTAMMDETRADPVMAIGRTLLLALLVLWTWRFATASVISNAAGASFLHLVNLPFHEAGHILFMPLGRFMTVLGGSLLQVLIPALLMIVFLTKHHDPFGAAVTCWWCGENLVDLAPYINDARDLQLVLLGGKTGAEVEGHDWEYLLTTLGWLHLDHTLGRLSHAIGVLIMCGALLWAARLVVLHWQRSRTASGQPLPD